MSKVKRKLKPGGSDSENSGKEKGVSILWNEQRTEEEEKDDEETLSQNPKRKHTVTDIVLKWCLDYQKKQCKFWFYRNTP